MLDVTHDSLQATAEQTVAQKFGVVHNANSAAALRDRTQLCVVQVAPVGEHAGDASVRDHERKRRVMRRHRVPKASGRNMRQIDEDLVGVQPPHVILAEGGEARIAAQRRAGSA